MIRSTISILIACLLIPVGSAFAQSFSSGSTAAQGVFPPAAIGTTGYISLTVNLATGGVTANSASTTTGTATLPGGAISGDAFPTGDLDFTTFTVPNGVTLKFLRNSANTPVTIRTTGDVTITGTIDLKGGNGNATTTQAILLSGGKGNVGGFDGGVGGTSAFFGITQGSPGLGRNGGVAGGYCCNVSGGGTFPHSNPGLIPLIGGSGGGGGGGDTGANGGQGGGGGGAILIASSTKIVVSGTVDAAGGSGGIGGTAYSCSYSNGAPGSGGAIRLVSNRVDISGALKVNPGTTSPCTNVGGGAGMIRLEAPDIVVSPTATATGATFTLTPGTIRPTNLPRLRITSIGGVSIPDSPVGAAGNIDVAVPSGTDTRAIVMTASNIPDGTTITVTVKAINFVSTTANATLQTADNVSTATVNIALPTTVSYIQAASAQFTLSAALQQRLPLFNGEKVIKAVVEFDGQREHTYFYTGSGQRVAAETLLGSK